MARQVRAKRDAEEKPTRRSKAAVEEKPVRKSRKAAAEEKPARRSRKPAEEKPTRRSKAVEEKPTRRSKAAVEEKPARRGRRVAEEKPTRKTRKAAEEAPARRSRKAAEDATEEKAARRTRKEKDVEEEAAPGFNPYQQLDSVLDDIEKDVGLSESSMDPSEKRLSTGNLMLDIILGGGLTAGWYTNFGQEQSCKTTGAVTILSAALNSNVPILYYYDFEGSASADYLENIIRNMGVNADAKSVFGIRDEKTGKWLNAPRVRYKSESVAEKFFDHLARLERMLPDKKKIGENWYYLYEDTKDNRKIVGSKYDVNYWRKTKMLRVPAPDGTLQALVLVDSYPAMLPEKQDVDDPNNAIATQARMFSDQLKRVKGKLRGKRIAVLGINQLRLKPMVAYGSPEYEPAGEALKLYSDVRLKWTSRALSAVGKEIGEAVKGNGQIEEEPSLAMKHGVDNYRYIHVRGHKNKLSRPYIEGWLRLWITDAKGEAQGFDPVWDTFIYLKQTGQVEGKRNKMLLKFKGNEARKTIGWMDFKRMILGDRKTVKTMCEVAGMKPVDLRKKCFAQMSSGVGIELYNQTEIDNRAAKASRRAEDADSSDSEDDND